MLKQNIKFGTLVIAIMIALAFPLIAGAAPIENNKLPFEMMITNPCNGDTVVLKGDMHETIHITVDKNGGYHIAILDNPINVTGVGSNGEIYKAKGVTRWDSQYQNGPGMVYVFANNFHIIGQRDESFWIHDNFHLVVTPNGVEMIRDNFILECKK